MKVEGEGQLLFMLPGTEKGVKHELQVTADSAMPEGLRILGIDFWHGLDSNVDMVSQTVSGTTPDGEHFKLRFHVERGANEKQINFITAEQADSEESINMFLNVDFLDLWWLQIRVLWVILAEDNPMYCTVKRLD